MRIAVIGGGIGGLGAAGYLARGGCGPVTVYEAAAQPGGCARGFRDFGFWLDCFYHHFFRDDATLWALIEELGLRSRVVRRPTTAGYWQSGRFLDFSRPWNLMTSFDQGPIATARHLAAIGTMLRRRRWEDLDETPAATWLRRNLGEDLAERLFVGLLRKKFGPEAERISLAWFWGRMTQRIGSRDLLGREQLYTFDGGMQTLVDALAADARRRGADVRLGEPVLRLSSSGPTWRVATAAGTEEYDAVVITLPLAAANFLDDEHLRNPSPKYIGAVNLVLALETSWVPCYWLNIPDTRTPLAAVVEHTRWISPAASAGRHIAYASRYATSDDAIFSVSPAEAEASMLAAIRDAGLPPLPNVLDRKLFRWRFSGPVCLTGHAATRPPEKLREGLFMIGADRIYPWDRGLDKTLELAADLVRSSFRGAS